MSKEIETKIQNSLREVIVSFDDFYIIDGILKKDRIISDLDNYKPELIQKILENLTLKEAFTEEIGNATIVKINDIIQLLEVEEYWSNSYTRYSNKIGLTVNNRFLDETADVLLDFPYKDTVLKGGMSKEEIDKEGADESFLNEIVAREEIDMLFDNKIFKNAKKYDKNGYSPVTEISDTDNLIIKGNNLLALHSLKERYAGKVKLIYIDPPYYFDGKKDGDTFYYNSNFKLSTWLTFMKNRLEVARDLLSDGGVLLVSMAEDGQAYLKVLMDNIFEKNDFVETFIWRNTDNADSLGKKTRRGVEYIHAYEKQKDSSVRWIGKDAENGDAPLINSSNPIGTLYFKEEVIRFNIPDGNYSAGQKTSVFLEDDLIIENGKNKNAIRLTGKFKWGQKYLDEEVSKGSDFVIKSNKFSIRYQKVEAGNVAPEKFVDERYLSKIFGVGTNEDANSHLKGLGLDFSYSKPESLLAFFIRAVTSENDIVLDFFMGSATTQAVAHKMNRQYIGVEQMEYIETISIERLKKVIDGEQGGISKDVNWQGGGSFIYAELMDKNSTFTNAVLNAVDSDELKEIFDEMKHTLDFDFRVDLNEVNQSVWNEEVETQKKILIKIIDKNQLYHNYSEMEDTNIKEQLSETDIAFNKSFYGE
ncbi:DNA methyltransferase [Globicatella sanguinis]